MAFDGPMIKTVDVRVDYDDTTAVRDLNLCIERGEIFGLIGPNGAGKTSTIRVLATLLDPTYGEVHIGGFDAFEQPDDVRRILGYMPDMAPVYDDLKVWEFLDLFAAAYYLDRRERHRKVDELLSLVHLQSKRDAMGGTLSRGMKQRLVLAKTLLHDPQVLLLDEPASGLDPIARVDLRELLRHLRLQGKTVLISSHILTELSGFCTSIGIMQKGSLIESGRIDEIIDRMAPSRRVLIDVIGELNGSVQLLEALTSVESVRTEGNRLDVVFHGSDDEAADMLAALVQREVRVRSFTVARMDVEDIVLRVGAREVS